MDELNFDFNKYKDTIAVIYQNKKYTYGYMNYLKYVLINSMEKLIEENRSTGGTVLIMLDRSPMLLASMWAAINLNYTYVLIDTLMPEERIRFIAADTGADLVITEEQYKIIFDNRNCLLVDSINIIIPSEFSDSAMNFEIPQIDRNNPFAYFLYTSGSTGKPKGVRITRKNLIYFFHSFSQEIRFEGKIASFTSISFDIFFLESILSFYNGITVILADEQEKGNPRLMCDLIKRYDADMVQLTPSGMQMLINYDKELGALSCIKKIMLGGEALPNSMLKHLQAHLPKTRIYNLYGPTETTIWVTVADLTDEDEVSIGHPIEGAEIFILDKNMNEVPDGEKGELCITGNTVGAGYINRDEVTRERFVYNDSIKRNMYRTGDYAVRGKNGKLYCLGRLDNQIKLHGHRIELEEIENVIRAVDGISNVIAFVQKNRNGDSLAALYTATKEVTESQIRSYMEKKVPDYMIPDKLYQTESLMFTLNGKVDRKRSLSRLEEQLKEKVIEDMELNKQEVGHSDLLLEQIMEVINEVSEEVACPIQYTTLLSDISLDSLTFVKFIISAESKFGIRFDSEKMGVHNYRTIQDLADYINVKKSGALNNER